MRVEKRETNVRLKTEWTKLTRVKIVARVYHGVDARQDRTDKGWIAARGTGREKDGKDV